MTTSSNLYAEKVFSEHPLALWSLDEAVDYVSLLSEADRSVIAPSWTVTGGTSSSSEVIGVEYPVAPLPGVTNTISPSVIGDDEVGVISLVAPIVAATPQDFNTSMNTFSVSSYIYPFSKSLNVSIGYTYSINGVEQAPVGIILPVTELNSWSFVSETFSVPQTFENLKPFISVSYMSTGSQYRFLLNGITVAQWPEQFYLESLGVEIQDVNAGRTGTIENPKLYVSANGVEAKPYGLQSLNGYYIEYRNTMCATNSGIPMVYGSSSSTKITPNDSGNPSLMIPGLGFLNVDGQYKDLTFEAWIKIKSSTSSIKRIFGPVASDDGVYVNDAFISLKIGKYSKSYFISEWERPMLMAVRVSNNYASLILNGEEVISMVIDTASLTLPEKHTIIDGEYIDNDWLGFYAHTDVPMLEVDCVGIYPYIVSNIIEKRRWIYGQAVQTPESINGSDSGSDIFIDYTVSNYAKNYTYPDIGRWTQGINENLSINNDYLELPKYELPSMVFSNRSSDEWYTDIPSSQDGTYPFINLRPNQTWADTEGYILFPKISVLNQQLQAIYGLFEVDATNEQKQTLFYMENQVTKESFEVSIAAGIITYSLDSIDFNGIMVNSFLVTEDASLYGKIIPVGIRFDRFISTYGGRLSTFFGSKKDIRLYVGGSSRLDSTFSGNIYRVGFCTARNLQKLSVTGSDIFSPSGVVNPTNIYENSLIADAGLVSTQSWEDEFDGGESYLGNSSSSFVDVADGGMTLSIISSYVISHIASYTLVPKILLGNYSIDIAVNGYWQDYTPLSYFGKYVVNENRNSTLDLDYLQFNVGYPQVEKYINGTYDTSESTVRTYISFKYLSDTSATNPGSYINNASAPESGVIYPGDNWETTRYEVINNMIIYPPSGVNLKSLAIITHIEMLSNGISENPIKIGSLQMASQALNSFVPTTIGTKTGPGIFSYTKSGVYYDYKGRNPFTIYKGSTPHMYLTSTSGIFPKDSSSYATEHGIYIPINDTSADFYRVAAWQMAIRYDQELFPTNLTEIFEIEFYDEDNVQQLTKFYMQAEDESAKRAKIYAVDALTGKLRSDIDFYINGIRVKTPYINLGVWSMLGLTFSTPLLFDGRAGALRFTGPLAFNNVSHYQSTQKDESSRFSYRKWSGLQAIAATETEPANEDVKWQYWVDKLNSLLEPYSWRDVLFVSSSDFVGITGKQIFQKYTGTDHFVVDTDDIFNLNNYEYKFYTDLGWQSSVVSSA